MMMSEGYLEVAAMNVAESGVEATGGCIEERYYDIRDAMRWQPGDMLRLFQKVLPLQLREAELLRRQKVASAEAASSTSASLTRG